LRFKFKLVAFNPANPFAELLYVVTELFLAPYGSLAGTPGSGGMLLEIGTLFVMLFYSLSGWAIEQVIGVIFYKPRDLPDQINMNNQIYPPIEIGTRQVHRCVIYQEET